MMIVTRVMCALLVLALLAGCTGNKGGDGSSSGKDVSSNVGGSSSNDDGWKEADVSDVVWKPVSMLSQKMIDAGIEAGEGCQWTTYVSYSYSNPDICYLGIDVGGMYRSKDGGKHWEPCTVGISSWGATGTEVDPTNSDRVLAVGCAGGTAEINGLYLSTDGGDSFKPVALYNICGHRDNRVQIAYDYSSYDKKLGYCTTVYWSRETLDSPLLYEGKVGPDSSPALFKSTDGGETWEVVNTSKEISCAQIAVDSKSGALFASSESGLFKSTDGGKSFKKVIDGMTTSVCTVISKPGHVWACKEDGVYYSSNGGDSFSKVSSNSFPTGCFPKIKVSPVDQNYMLLGADALRGKEYVSKQYYSQDGGKTWALSDMNQDNGFYYNAMHQSSMAMHPKDKNKALALGGDNVMLSTNGGALFKKSVAGYNAGCWTSFSINPNNPNLIAIANQDYTGAYTKDGGKTWTAMYSTSTRLTDFTYGAYMVDEQTLIYIARDDAGLFKQGKGAYVICRSADGGRTFTPCGKTVRFMNSIQKFIVMGVPGNNNTVIAHNLISFDKGATWSEMDGCDYAFTYSLKTGELYGIDGSKVVKSTDGGKTWQRFCDIIPDLTICGMAYGEQDGSLWVAAAEGIVMHIVDGKVNFVKFTEIDDKRVTSVACDPFDSNIVYISCNIRSVEGKYGIFRTTDGGKTWGSMVKTSTNGVTNDGIGPSSMVLCHPITGELYSIGACRGMWKTASPAKK